MIVRAARLRIAPALLLAACFGSQSDGPAAVRLATVFQPDPEAVAGVSESEIPRTEWRFDAPGAAPALGGWKSGQGVRDLALRDGRLVGRTTSEKPVVYVSRTQGPFDADLLHEIEVRIRISAGTKLTVVFSGDEELDVGGALYTSETFQDRATTPLVTGEQIQTYTLRWPDAIAASQIRHVLLLPTDAAGARFELESLRLIFRREYLADIPAGFSWQGLSGIFMDTLVVRSPGSVEIELTLPDEPWLDLSLGTVDHGAVTFRLAASSPGRDGPERLLLERTITTPHQWESTPVDLAELAGENVRLTFSMHSAQEGAIGFWGSPVARSRSAAASDALQGVIVIWADTLRWDHLDVYGYERETAPLITSMAKEGLLFHNLVTQATWTKVSTPSLMTSLYPSSHGVKALTDRIPAVATTISEVYQAAGHATFSFASNNFTGQFTNLHQGFDVVHEVGSLPDARSSKTTRIGMDRLFPWLEAHRDVRFFVFLSVLDPHDPYKSYPPYDTIWADPAGEAEHERHQEQAREHIQNPILKIFGMPSRAELDAAGVDADAYVAFDLDWYDGSIRGMDAEVGRLFERLRSLGLDEKTLVVFTSDHGEEFLEHGRMFHGQSAYGELNRVPLVIRWPGGLPAGREIDAPVETLDLMPTLLELSGLPAPEGMQGQSLLPLLSGGEGWESRPVITEKWSVTGIEKPPDDWNAMAIVADGWKLIHNFKRYPPMPEYELYDFVNDPLDLVDVAADHPDVVARLVADLGTWRERAESERVSTDAEAAQSLSAEDLERLKALGYIE